MEGIVVVSAFDGMACLYAALTKAGIKVKKYFAYEVDQFAIEVARKNFPDIIHLGDITKASLKDFGNIKVDLFCGGSPCQGFSFAGKQLNFADPRSKLFFEFVRLWVDIQEQNPNAKFLLENVNMKKEYQRVISEYMGVFPVRINSNLVSAQNRDRLYWTNIRTKKVGLFGEIWSDIPQPGDQGIFLEDILQNESEIDEKYYLKNAKNSDGLDLLKKSNTLRASSHCSQSKKHNFDVIKVAKDGKIKKDQSKASCITGGGNSGGNHSDMDIICVAMRGRNIVDGKRKDYNGAPTEQRLEPNKEGETNCLTSNLILIQKGHGFNKGGEFKFKSPTLLSNSWEHNNHISDGYRLRRLTLIECERLQTLPDNFTNHVSDSQRYKMLGNGWTINVIAHILSFLT